MAVCIKEIEKWMDDGMPLFTQLRHWVGNAMQAINHIVKDEAA